MLKFASKQIEDGFMRIDPKLKELAVKMSEWWTINYGKDFTLTETWTSKAQDDALNRVSSSHREGRAFDVRVRDFKHNEIALFMQAFQYADNELGAVSSEDGIRRCIVYKVHGSGPHFHVQIGKDKITKKEIV